MTPDVAAEPVAKTVSEPAAETVSEPDAPTGAEWRTAAADVRTPDVPTPNVRPYDALLLMSFGGPEAPEDVMPFLIKVTSGRGIPPERLTEVAEHYHHFGGRSPINDQNRSFLAAMKADFSAHGIDIPIVWGNRNWDPFLVDALRELRDLGARRVAVFVTSAYSSYSGCRQYRENFASAIDELQSEGGAPIQLDKLRHYFDHPGFVAANARGVADAMAAVLDPQRVLFVTHSIPVSMQESSGPSGGQYDAQHHATAAAVMAVVTNDHPQWIGVEHELVYCSRSGPPHIPWSEPDVNDRLRELAAEGVTRVVLAPIGFVSDHMEVVFDLDTEARETADELGMTMARAATAGVDTDFVTTVRDLLVERAAIERGERVARRRITAQSGPAVELPPDRCVANCCPNPRGNRPALCGQDV